MTTTQSQIRAYKNAFYYDDKRGSVIYVPSLNEWFAKCEITIRDNLVTLTGKMHFFESDPFTVMPELPKRFELAMQEAGYPPLEISIIPTDNKISYKFNDADRVRDAGSFLMSLRHYVKQGFKIKEREARGEKPRRME